MIWDVQRGSCPSEGVGGQLTSRPKPSGPDLLVQNRSVQLPYEVAVYVRKTGTESEQVSGG